MRPTAPALALAVKTRQRLGKTLRVAVSVGEDVWASARGKLRIAGRPYSLRHTVGRLVARGEQLTLKLGLPPTARAAARRALSRGEQVKATVTVRVTDTAGNSSSATRTLRLRR